LQRIFDYPVACSDHCDSEGHLILHILDGSPDGGVHVDLTAYTAIPIRSRIIDTLLILMILPDKHYGISPEDLRFDIHPECLAQILEIGKAIRNSQFSSLTVLSQLSAQVIRQDLHGEGVCSEELAGMSIGVIRALHLTNDPRVALVIPDLVSGMRNVKKATIAISKLMTHLAGMRIFGGRHCGILACAQSRESHSPAVGWLEMLKD
jgi:hypothetical protein